MKKIPFAFIIFLIFFIAVAVILHVEENSENIKDDIEEVFLYFHTEFRRPDIFFIYGTYGTEISNKIKFYENTEIVYIDSSAKLIVAEFSIRSDGNDVLKKDRYQEVV